MDLCSAFGRLTSLASPVGQRLISTMDATGRTAADAMRAPAPAPGFARSLMDGYLCHAGDIAAADHDQPAALRVTGSVRIGEIAAGGPLRGEAWAITTGGPLPPTGDVVVPLEATSLQDEYVLVRGPLPPGRNVAPPGNDVRQDEPVVRAGEVITAALAAALLAAGVSEVPVYKRPRVLILSTGDEVIDNHRRDAAHGSSGRVRNSNALYLSGELQALGIQTKYGGVVRDDPDALQQVFEGALASDCDLILTTGGVSVGPHDYVPAAWLELGVDQVVGRLSLKPGGPLFIGRHWSKWVVSLSGSPPACMTAYQLLVRPLMLRLMGREQLVRPIVPVRVDTPFTRAATGLRALWARVGDDQQPSAATLTSDSDAGRLVAFARSNAIVLMPAGTPPLNGGEILWALRLDQPEDRDSLQLPDELLTPRR